MLTCLRAISPVSSRLLEERAVSGSPLYHRHPQPALHLAPSPPSSPAFPSPATRVLPQNQMQSSPSPAQTLVCYPVAQITEHGIQGLPILAQQEDGKSPVSLKERQCFRFNCDTYVPPESSLPLFLLVPGVKLLSNSHSV